MILTRTQLGPDSAEEIQLSQRICAPCAHTASIFVPADATVRASHHNSTGGFKNVRTPRGWLRFVAVSTCLLALLLPIFSAHAAATSSEAPVNVAGADAFLDRPIIAIQIDVPVGEDATDLLGLIDIQPGYLLAKSDIQAAIERLYALGRFSQVEAMVVPLEQSVILRLVVSPQTHLEKLFVTGLRSVPAEPLMRLLAVGPGDPIDAGTKQALVRRTKYHLAQVGYPVAQVKLNQQPGVAPNTQSLTLKVSLGPATRIVGVTLSGPMRVPKAVLKAVMRSRVGAPLDSETLEADRQRLIALMHEHGFVRASVSQPEVTHDVEGAHVGLRIVAHEQLSFRFVGSHALGPAELLALWPATQSGPPQASLGVYRRRILQALARLSYPNAEVNTRLIHHRRQQQHAQGPDATVWVNVRENSPIWVRRLVLEDTPVLPKEVISGQIESLLLRELGEVNFFSKINSGTWATHLSPQEPLPRSPHRIPAARRWVAELYERVGYDVAAALRELGYTEAEVGIPSYTPLANDLLRPDGRCADGGPCSWPDDGLSVDQPSVLPPGGRLSDNGPRPVTDADAHLSIHPGRQHFIGNITYQGCEALDAQALAAAVRTATSNHPLRAPIEPGAPLSAQGIEDGRIALVRALRDQGFHYARAFVTIAGEDQDFADVSYFVEEGPAVCVSHVLIRGNIHTRQGVIRSRMTLAPNSLYRLPTAVADQRDIMALGTFGSVRVKLTDEEHPAESKDVVVDVEERPRQPIEVVPGISTASGPRLRAAYSHINVLGTATVFVASLKLNRQVFFELYGPYADTLRTRFAAYSGSEQFTRAIEREVRLGLRSPPIKHLPFDPLLRLDLVDQRINAVRYGLDATTATFGVDTTFARRLKASLEVQGGITHLECPLGDNCNQNPDVRRLRGGYPIQEGIRHTIKVGPSLVYEGRDDPISPTRGLFLSGRVTQAVGSAKPQLQTVPFAFLKWEATATTYVPLWGMVLALSARAGSIDIQRNLVPVDERFFLGGRDTLRGFVETTLIPQDACVVDDADQPLAPHCNENITNTHPPLSLGGNTFGLLKTELRLPLRDNFSLDLFADLGNLWVSLRHNKGFDLRIGTGLGLRYATPVGALTVDFGINPARRHINAEAGWQVHFSIGSF